VLVVFFSRKSLRFYFPSELKNQNMILLLLHADNVVLILEKQMHCFFYSE